MAARGDLERVPRTDLAEARRAFASGSLLFVDVRSEQNYREGHIPGAMSVPLATQSHRFFGLPRDREFILY